LPALHGAGRFARARRRGAQGRRQADPRRKAGPEYLGQEAEDADRRAPRRHIMIETGVTIAILLMLGAVTIGIVRVRGLFAAVVLLGIYSLLMATLFIVLDAVDVAMTEAAVGAGVSTVFF